MAKAEARALATLLASLLDPNVAKRRGSTARKYHQQSQLYMVLGEIARLLRALIPTRQMSESQCFSNFDGKYHIQIQYEAGSIACPSGSGPGPAAKNRDSDRLISSLNQNPEQYNGSFSRFEKKKRAIHYIKPTKRIQL